MSKNAAGTYAYGEFDDNNEELDRLKNQAEMGVAFEKKVWAHTGLKDGMKIMDLACGPGITAVNISQTYPKSDVLGVDINELLLHEAKKHNNPNLKFQQGDVYNLDLPSDTYDYIYARFLFQHLDQPEKALENIYRMLKPGGKVVIVDVDDQLLVTYPDSENFKEFTNLAADFQKKNGGDRYVGRKFKSYFQKTGFSTGECEVFPITTQEIGAKNFVDITTGFKKETIQENKEKVKNLLDKIYQSVEKENFWGFVGVCIGIGTK